MTGFGRGEASVGGWNLSVELTGVNRKQIDLALNLPNSLTELEPEFRRVLTDAISRGRINARVTLRHVDTGSHELAFDETLARQYVDALQTIARETGLLTEFSAGELLRAPGVFRVEEASLDVSEIRDALFSALQESLDHLHEMQDREGALLRDDMEQRIQSIESEIATVQSRSRLVVDRYRNNLNQRLRESGLEINFDDDRLLREVGLFAERCDISEEITRIHSHLSQFRTYFSSEKPPGRALDFLCQELNRELNTIGSKANDATIAQCIVNSKTELEKVREQVQNVQ